jgi:hypothetical protein
MANLANLTSYVANPVVIERAELERRCKLHVSSQKLGPVIYIAIIVTLFGNTLFESDPLPCSSGDSDNDCGT